MVLPRMSIGHFDFSDLDHVQKSTMKQARRMVFGIGVAVVYTGVGKGGGPLPCTFENLKKSDANGAISTSFPKSL